MQIGMVPMRRFVRALAKNLHIGTLRNFTKYISETMKISARGKNLC